MSAPPWEWDVQPLEGSLSTAKRPLDGGMGSVVADHQDAVHLNVVLRPAVVGRVDVGKCVSNGGGGDVLPSFNRFAEPRPKLLLDRRGIR